MTVLLTAFCRYSALLMDSDGRVARPNAANRNSRLLQQSKRSTRLFGSFGGSGSEKGIEGNRRSSGSTLGSGREAPSSMSPRTVDQATREMMVEETEAVQAGENLLEKIGTPDYSGWMQKKGEKYNTWKQRFFVLKGVHLYYLKSESVSDLPRAHLRRPPVADAVLVPVGATSQGLY